MKKWMCVALMTFAIACGDDAKKSASNNGVNNGSNNGTGDAPLNHRASAVECDSDRPFTEIPAELLGAECTTHEECTAGDNGRCVDTGRLGYACTYDTCFNDSDCDGLCTCGTAYPDAVNYCLGGDCVVDSDCGTDGYCSPSFGDCGNYSGVIGYYCHTAEDTCVNDTDCGSGSPGDPYCAYDPAAGHWACSDLQCVG